jgi:hypothetical protein
LNCSHKACEELAARRAFNSWRKKPNKKKKCTRKELRSTLKQKLQSSKNSTIKTLVEERKNSVYHKNNNDTICSGMQSFKDSTTPGKKKKDPEVGRQKHKLVLKNTRGEAYRTRER